MMKPSEGHFAFVADLVPALLLGAPKLLLHLSPRGLHRSRWDSHCRSRRSCYSAKCPEQPLRQVLYPSPRAQFVLVEPRTPFQQFVQRYAEAARRHGRWVYDGLMIGYRRYRWDVTMHEIAGRRCEYKK